MNIDLPQYPSITLSFMILIVDGFSKCSKSLGTIPNLLEWPYIMTQEAKLSLHLFTTPHVIIGIYYSGSLFKSTKTSFVCTVEMTLTWSNMHAFDAIVTKTCLFLAKMEYLLNRFLLEKHLISVILF